MLSAIKIIYILFLFLFNANLIAVEFQANILLYNGHERRHSRKQTLIIV